MKRSIMLDPGHGGKDSGAVGPTGLKEKDVVLSVCQIAKGMLIAAGVDVFMTRTGDTFVELPERAATANSLGVDRYLSVHCNSAQKAARGFEVFTMPGKTSADPFATSLFLAFGNEFPDAIKRIDSSDGDPDKEASFAVLRLSRMPAALFELEFIHDAKGESFLREAQNLMRCARALSAGVLTDLGIWPASATKPVDEDNLTTLRRLLAQSLALNEQIVTVVNRMEGGA